MVKELLFEINTRYWLHQLRERYDTEMTLSTVPDSELESVARKFDWVWLMGVWDHSELDQEFIKHHPGLITEVEEALEDWTDGDIIGSPYSIIEYDINPMLGSREDFIEIRKRFNQMGVKVMVDFVPNHFGFHSDLAVTNPDYFVNCSEKPEDDQLHLFKKVETHKGIRWIAHGKDPYFPPWDDTFQVNIWNPQTQEFMVEQLKNIAKISDGVRCDMAMLINNDIFEETWGWLISDSWDKPEKEFWPVAISETKEENSDFLFLAEVYWDKEWELLQMGFDFAYDKRLYDRFLADDLGAIHHHLQADITYQAHMCRFIENHDEDRALVSMSADQALAATAMIATLPGMTLIHQGQITGQKIKIPVQLLRKTHEEPKQLLLDKYEKIIDYSRDLISNRAIWHNNDVIAASELPSDSIFAWSWQTPDNVCVIAVNYADREADGLIRLNTDHNLFDAEHLYFIDYYNDSRYKWHSANIIEEGLYVRLGPYDIHLMTVESAD